MKQMQAYFMMGTSGSGKSTIGRKIRDKIGSSTHHPVYFSMDDCRHVLFMESGEPIPKGPAPLYAAAFQWCSEHREQFDEYVTKLWAEMLQFALKHSSDVICDNTHLNQGYREKWITELRERGFFINLIYVKVPLDIVLERQKHRDKDVPREVLEAQYAKLEEPLEHEYDRLIVIDGTKEITDEEWQQFLSHN